MNVLDRQKSIEHLLPNEIEKRSFEIISKELKERGIELPKEEEMITKRVIHTVQILSIRKHWYIQNMPFGSQKI